MISALDRVALPPLAVGCLAAREGRIMCLAASAAFVRNRAMVNRKNDDPGTSGDHMMRPSCALRHLGRHGRATLFRFTRKMLHRVAPLSRPTFSQDGEHRHLMPVTMNGVTQYSDLFRDTLPTAPPQPVSRPGE